MAQRVRWIVVGGGRSGALRAAAILAHPDCELVGAVGLPGLAGAPPFATLADAIDLADAVALGACGEPPEADLHAVLGAGRHVVAPPPVASSADAFDAVVAAAAEARRILHLDSSAALAGPIASLRANLPLGVASGALIVESSAGDDVRRDLARGVLQLVHVAGPVEAVEGRPDGSAALTLVGGAQIRASARVTGAAVPRAILRLVDPTGAAWRVDEAGLWRDRDPQTLLEARTPEARDHDLAMAAIRSGVAGGIPRSVQRHVAAWTARLIAALEIPR